MNGAVSSPEPDRDCGHCPRLVAYRQDNKAAEPKWFNGAVPSFGDPAARLLIVGLAPGRSGANRTGRPFTGDYAGVLLYETLLHFGFAVGQYGASPSDGLALSDCMITNAVRCAPPENKPTPAEIKTCRSFLLARLRDLPNLKAIVVLGRIAHDQLIDALSLRKALFPFKHAASHHLPSGLALYDSFHCSRYNTNTGRLTTPMFHQVFSAVRADLDRPQSK